jgi:hypothetical protein
MAVVLGHEGTRTQRGTKAGAVTEVFAFLGVLVPWWHSFPSFHYNPICQYNYSLFPQRVRVFSGGNQGGNLFDHQGPVFEVGYAEPRRRGGQYFYPAFPSRPVR